MNNNAFLKKIPKKTIEKAIEKIHAVDTGRFKVKRFDDVLIAVILTVRPVHKHSS
jgi:hypothetical protein